MFEAYTAEVLLADVLAQAPDGIDTRKGSIFYDAVSGIVEKIAKMYTDLDQVFEYVFISTASGEYLDMKASEYGLERLSATPAKYKLVYEGIAPATGARFFHNETGLYFKVAVDDGIYILVAEETGTGGNSIAEGDLAVPVNTITGLTASSFGELYAYGTEQETDEDLRTRIQEKIAEPAENGNKQNYKTWCESINGVGLARIIPLWGGPNTVKGVLISPEGLACGEETVKNVQDYIDPITSGETVEVDGKTYVVGDGLGEGVGNLGAHFIAAAANEVGITVKFTAVLASNKDAEDAKGEVEKALKEYFKEIALGTESESTVRFTNVGAIIAGVNSVEDYSDLTINEDTENNISLEVEDVPVVSEVIVNVNV